MPAFNDTAGQRFQNITRSPIFERMNRIADFPLKQERRPNRRDLKWSSTTHSTEMLGPPVLRDV